MNPGLLSGKGVEAVVANPRRAHCVSQNHRF